MAQLLSWPTSDNAQYVRCTARLQAALDRARPTPAPPDLSPGVGEHEAGSQPAGLPSGGSQRQFRPTTGSFLASLEGISDFNVTVPAGGRVAK